MKSAGLPRRRVRRHPCLQQFGHTHRRRAARQLGKQQDLRRRRQDGRLGKRRSVGSRRSHQRATLYIQMTRYMASTPLIDNVWIDDLDRSPFIAKSPRSSPRRSPAPPRHSTLGNFTVKRINGPTAGQMEPFFPKCILGADQRSTLRWYADRGWNCIWGATSTTRCRRRHGPHPTCSSVGAPLSVFVRSRWHARP